MPTNKPIPNIRFWNPAAQYRRHKGELDKAIFEVLESGQWVLGSGPYVEKFEKEFAKFIGKRYAVMVRNGTSALYLAYRGLGIGPGDEVLIPSNTFIATIDQVAALGAKPILVDCNLDGLIDLEDLKKKITKKTVAVVPVHMEGKVCDMKEILKLAKQKRVVVIEDAAQAIGARGVGKGLAQCYSLYPAKILGSFGNSGMVTTNDKALADRIRMLRCNSNIGKNPDLNAEFGMNMEPENRDAAYLSVKLKYLPRAIEGRRQVAMKYFRSLKDLPIALPSNQAGRVWQDFMINTRDRDALQKYLKEQGIEALVPNPRIPNHKYRVLNHFKLPTTDLYIETKLALPCNDTITSGEVKYICDKIRDFYSADNPPF